jgi:hypothetical protein
MKPSDLSDGELKQFYRKLLDEIHGNEDTQNLFRLSRFVRTFEMRRSNPHPYWPSQPISNVQGTEY